METLIGVAKQLATEQTRALTTALRYIPAERHHWVPGGCAKSAMQIYLQCAGEYLNLAKFLRGDPVLPWPAVLEAANARLTLDDAQALMQSNEEQYLQALGRLDEAALGKSMKPPWGGSMTWRSFVLATSHHLAYHYGQLNYIQTLLGDGKEH
jgi:hypothetical protein